MTETEWLACDEPRRMLGFVRDKASERQLRMFVLACCRDVWGDTEDAPTRVALASIQRLAEGGRISVRKTSLRVRDGQAVLDCGASDPLGPLSVWGEGGSPRQVGTYTLPSLLVLVLETFGCSAASAWEAHVHDWLVNSFEQGGLSGARQAGLLRDVVRGPFAPLHFQAAWRTQEHRMSVRIGQSIYDEEAFEELPILADALEEAGCTSQEVLDHLRGPGPHVRGCWPLDLLLNRT